MTMHDDRDELETGADRALHERLRALPTLREPPSALWSAIERGIAPPVSMQPAPPLRRRRRGWIGGGLAMAAALGVLAVLLVPRLRQPEGVQPPLLVQQADAMSGVYHQAITALPVNAVPADLAPALRELDESAARIRAAIAQSPESGFLLGQLQRTYSKRLELTRLAMLDSTTRPT